MRKYFIYILVWPAVAILAASCVSPFDNPVAGKGDRTVLRLAPAVAGISTKADTEAGDDTYNENIITDYYWYIFSDAAGTTCVLSGHQESDEAKEIILDDYFPSGGTGYVYVAANLPEAPTATTYADLKDVSFGTSMPTTYPDSSEFYKYTSATTGVPKPEKFVMRTDTLVPFTLVEKTVVSVPAQLKRVASKIILDLYVAEEVEQTKTLPSGGEEYVKTWLSDIGHIQIYMLWGSTHGNLAGTQFHYGDDGVESEWFYSASPRYAMYTNPKGGVYDASTNTVSGSVPHYDGEGTAPVGQYKETTLTVSSSVWEQVYKVNLDANGDPIWNWNASTATEDRTDANIGNTAYGDWDYVLDGGEKVPATDALGNYQYKLGTESKTIDAYSISSLPLYSMPISWGVSGAHAPFIKIILPWRGHTRGSDGTETDEGSWTWDPKTTEFYYKILVPGRTTLDANGCYHISVDLSVLGSEADEVPVELYSTYHVVDWNTAETMGGVESAGRYLDCGDLFEFYSQNSMEIPVSSSHDITVTDVSVTYNDYSGSTVSVATLDDSEYSITPFDNTKVTIAHTMETTLANMHNQDVARINYTFRIQHGDDESYYKEVKVIQYPPVYITADPNPGGDTATNGNSFGHVYVNGNTRYTGSDTYWYYPFGLDGAGNTNTNMFILHVSVLEDSYLIGDPRVETGGDPSGGSVTWASAPGVEGSTSRKLQKFRKVEADDRTTNMIAPILRVASSYGAAYRYTFNNARYRCASYQEDGLPAGRWRLPTMAEIKYLVNLSARGLIIRLFGSETGTTNYWCANGYATVDNENNTVTNTSGDYSNSSTTNYVRCVYDEWYWGETTNNDTVRGQYRSTFTWGDETN